MRFIIYRYQPGVDHRPRHQHVTLQRTPEGGMLLDALEALREQDPSFAFRRSCGEGVCGSDAMNINGRNGLPCITPLAGLKQPVRLAPLPGLPVIRDLVVDLTGFLDHYRRQQPHLMQEQPPPERERLQSPEQRAALDGLWECILCACCTSACPSFWWNPERFPGPAALLAATRFVQDSRDDAMDRRLDTVEDPWQAYRCHGIMSCVDACPKGLNPTRAIGSLKALLVARLT